LPISHGELKDPGNFVRRARNHVEAPFAHANAVQKCRRLQFWQLTVNFLDPRFVEIAVGNANAPLPQTSSLYLDVARFLSAAIVFLFHLSYGGFGGNGFSLHTAGDVVMVFFVLSGFIISYTAEREENLPVFMTARLARLWSVVIPALALTLAADTIGNSINPDFYTAQSYDGSLPILRVVASAMFLNEIWFRSICPLSNLPFWSIGYEFWYYVLFAAAFYLSGVKRKVAVMVTALVAGPKILLLFPVWLLGAAVYHLNKRAKAPEAAGWLMFFLPPLLYAGCVAANINRHIDYALQSTIGRQWTDSLGNSNGFVWLNIVGILVAIHFLGFFAIQHRFRFLISIENPIRSLAGCTLSCYLLHFPLFMLFSSLLRPSPNSVALNLVIGALAGTVIAVLGPHLERSRYPLRSYLSERVQASLGSERKFRVL
jgi:peptidoglycan/LPS O-acetylase OafA/YrhL